MTRQMADDEVLRVLRQAATVIDEERCPISSAITEVIATQSRAERAESALEALRGQVAELEADAARYRWLRRHLVNWCPDDGTASLSWYAREVLDAAIDAAASGAGE